MQRYIMRVQLDHQSGEPIYRQIVEAVKLWIARGDLSDGAKLPSMRQLASELQINPRTVAKAYEKLAAAGLVVMQQGRGVFVTSPKHLLPSRERRKVLQEHAQRLMSEAARVGASPAEVIDIVQGVAGEMVPKQ